ncbi:hypothetical protein HYU45_02770 [Candidatus Daviesbacteria bacterium]|nr:hypothetical protein [Candidatus Daviesbacteria bacterium]
MLKTINFKNHLSYILLGLILLVHTLILTRLIYFPYPELFIYPYLTNNGLAPYRQILDQHFPGLMFLPINLNNLGMSTPEIARLWSISIVLITHAMLFLIAGKIFKSRSKALLINFLYLIWQPFFEGWVLWIDSFLPLLLLPAFYAFYRRWFFAAGLLLGIAIVFKQTIIPLSAFILIYILSKREENSPTVYIFWRMRNFQTCLRFLLGLSIPVSLMIAYFISIGVFRDFWFWTVIFNLTTFAEFGRGSGPTLAHFSRVLLVFGTAFLVIRRIKSVEAQVLLIFLVGTLIGLSTRFDFVHFQPALPFALMATVLGVGELGPSTSLRVFERLGRLGFIGIYSLVLVWWLVIFYKGHLGDRVISFDSQTKDLAAKIRDYTNPGEKIFVFGAQPHLYQMSGTLPAGDIFVFQFPWFFQVAERRILTGIIKDKPKIVVSDRTTRIEDRKITDFAKNIDIYINQNYEKIDSVGTTDILRRKG